MEFTRFNSCTAKRLSSQSCPVKTMMLSQELKPVQVRHLLLIPIFQHLINTKFDSQYMVKAVVAPTRDLALQIEAEVKKSNDMNYGLKSRLVSLLVGGTDFRAAMNKMNKLRPNIVIANQGD
ncbi:ATV_HP_G0147030.mRNA.1.CDS.1 [Saccharomyces cerevisiae]|nr:ATV_HP_G0147030.mRNA.1.CDS.1 [Saccharomyces cerevisiae]CAI6924883.1 ATV_HP_G0147030.mRNA.1.CDS.1 [Saccharomyces cerevisiae]